MAVLSRRVHPAWTIVEGDRRRSHARRGWHRHRAMGHQGIGRHRIPDWIRDHCDEAGPSESQEWRRQCTQADAEFQVSGTVSAVDVSLNHR